MNNHWQIGQRVVTNHKARSLVSTMVWVIGVDGEADKDFEDEYVALKAGLKGTVVSFSPYSTEVKFDHGKEHRVQAGGLDELNLLDQIAEALDDPKSAAV